MGLFDSAVHIAVLLADGNEGKANASLQKLVTADPTIAHSAALAGIDAALRDYFAKAVSPREHGAAPAGKAFQAGRRNPQGGGLQGPSDKSPSNSWRQNLNLKSNSK